MDFLKYFRPVRLFLKVISADRSPRQIAWGVALGMMIGLVPKGNLIAVALTLLLFSLRTNLGLGLLTAFICSFAAAPLDRLTHGIGARALQVPAVYDTLSRAFQLPLVPWTSLNNTIVLGSVLLGVLLFYPTLHLTELVATRLQPYWKQGVRSAKQRLRRKSRPADPTAEMAVPGGTGGEV